MDAKARIIQLIDDKQQEFIECSDAIWGYAETRFATRQSADAHIRVLEIFLKTSINTFRCYAKSCDCRNIFRAGTHSPLLSASV